MTTQTRIPQGSPWRQTPRWLGISAWAIVIVAIAIAVLALVAITAGVVSFAPARVADAGAQMRPEAPAVPQQPVAVTAPAPAPAPQAPVPAVSQNNGAAAPAPANWPIVQVNWKYTDQVVPTPPGVDAIYSGVADIYWPGSGDENVRNSPGKMEIVNRIVSKDMLDDELILSLSIVRNPDNPNIRLAAITIHRGSKFMRGAKAGDQLPPIALESHVYLTTDAEKSWTEIRLPPGFKGETNSIDDTRVSGTSALLLSYRAGSNPFYTQAEFTP